VVSLNARELATSRFVTVRVCDTRSKYLLRGAHLVQIDHDKTFHDVLVDLPSDVTDGELLSVKLIAATSTACSCIQGTELRRTVGSL
jgi:hypothetical protein